MNVHVANNSGDNEWFSPVELVNAARIVMGEIDLDPASCGSANAVVEARKYYSIEDDGLKQHWSGRVWMNPPYSRPAISHFSTRLVKFFESEDVTQACVLVNNATETKWFQAIGSVASAVCFLDGRLKFWHPRKGFGAPLQGQAVLYLGSESGLFYVAFEEFGRVYYPASCHT